MENKESNPKERTQFLSRITDWQRRNRSHVRRQLKKHQDERVNRNSAHRILEKSGRKKVCAVAGCNATTGLEAAHKDNNTNNNAPGNLEWRCPRHHKTKPKGTPQQKVQK